MDWVPRCQLQCVDTQTNKIVRFADIVDTVMGSPSDKLPKEKVEKVQLQKHTNPEGRLFKHTQSQRRKQISKHTQTQTFSKDLKHTTLDSDDVLFLEGKKLIRQSKP